MKRSPLLYLLLIGAMLVVACWTFVRFYRAVKVSMAPTVCVTDVSPLCSDATAVAMVQYVEHAVLNEHTSLRQLAASMQKSFGHCSSITCRQRPSGLVQVDVDVDDPFFMVNEDLVLTEHGFLVPRDFFVADSLALLPHMVHKTTGATLPSISPALQTFLKQLPCELLTQHTIDYQSDEEVWLVATESADVPVIKPAYVCSVATVFDEVLLGHCGQVVADLEQQQALTKKKTRTAWVLDLRFDKQVILYPRMGGQVHG